MLDAPAMVAAQLRRAPVIRIMRSLPPETLPTDARIACERLTSALRDLLGPNLVALWAYGAPTFPDCTKRLGDIDTYGLLSHTLGIETAAMIDKAHDTIAMDLGIEWDSWYILRKDAMGIQPPKHALREHLVDDAWALHRAHWLAGQYVLLAGSTPPDFVRPPSWDEIEDGLKKELRYIERFVTQGQDDPGHAAYAVWNGCRLVYSMETGNVVVSKKSAALWALDRMSSVWRASILAAGRVYDGDVEPDDAATLKATMVPFIAYVRDRITRRWS